jgi:hypothetical protein
LKEDVLDEPADQHQSGDPESDDTERQRASASMP